MSVFSRPRGIAFRVLLGLALLALAALIVCVLAIYSFRETSSKLDEVTSGFLPLVTVSAKLGTDSIILSNSVAEIIAVNSKTELETVGFRLADQVALITRTKVRLTSLGADPDILQRFTTLQTKLIKDSNSLVELVRQRIEIQQSIELQITELDKFIQYFRLPPKDSALIVLQDQNATQARSIEQHLADWEQLSLSVGLTALEVPSIHNRTILQKRINNFSEIRDKQQAIQRQLMDEDPRLKTEFAALNSLWKNPMALYNSRDELLQKNSNIQGTLGNHLQLSEQLAEFFADYSNQVQIQAEELRTDINDELSRRTQALTLGFVLILIIAAMVFFYVDHHVVSRVQALDRKIRGYSTGIESYGQPRDKDEIEEIETSFAFFTRSIEQRETELRELSNIASDERDKAETANQSKTNLLKAASHDLRQPLHAMTLFLANLKAHITTTIGLELHDALAYSIREMGATFDKILDLSGTHNEHHEAKHFKLTEVFSRLETEFTLAAKDSGNTLEITSNDFVAFSDPDAVYRIIGNLLTNALRYAPASHIHLYATLTEDTLEAFVCDTGPGIHKENQTKVFDDNYSISESKAGRGMGLAIAQELAQSISSDLLLSSNQPTGAIFHFCIRAGNPALVETHSVEIEPIRTSKLEGLEILLVDDEHSVLKSTQMLLEGWGCKVHCYLDADSATKQFNNIDEQTILITDLHLGRSGSGLEVAYYFSKRTGSTDRVIVISADHSKETKESIIDSGYHHIRKPMNPGQLATLLRNLQNNPVSAATLRLN